MKKTTTTICKSYSELAKLKTFKERFEYLKLSSKIGDETFGHERRLNQMFYGSPEWKAFRREAIIRDNGCDMGLPGFDIGGRIEIHHINPITKNDIINRSQCLMDLENVVCVSSQTHKAVHYGGLNSLPSEPVVRKPNDTCPWKN